MFQSYVILQAYILPVQQVCLIICGKRLERILSIYKSYPRIVGETGGKDFVIAHKTADPDVVVTALLRGAFEFQGQKCSAASRAYIPSNIAEEVKKKLIAGVKSFKMGTAGRFYKFYQCSNR